MTEKRAYTACCPTCGGVVTISTTDPDAAAGLFEDAHRYGLTVATVGVDYIRGGTYDWCGCEWSKPPPDPAPEPDLFSEVPS